MSSSEVVQQLSPDKVREMMAGAPGSFVLIDVRESEEYGMEHLPGSMNVPFSELESRADVLKAMPEGFKVLYCRSGVRSDAAARLLTSRFEATNIYSMDGGLNAWGGDRLSGLPRLKAIAVDGSVAEVLLRALNLEKGAERLYAGLLERLRSTAARPVLEKLVRAEQSHEESIYRLLIEESKTPLEPLDRILAKLPGDVLESGEELSVALDRSELVGKRGAAGALELALDLELTAYDMYRNLAHRATSVATREVLLRIAGEERVHAANVLRGMNEVYADSNVY